ncbi:P-loop containing nucleoside triphosphate hydrolase protein [Rhodotorula diobovata]|uniref:P-loop containing nucleoside triphosphate hydrolase protein n=1 Tax=Rhodotorula diobovata TaxID=5288 RepID=A0A5C5FPX7_9BASI|nr:P-loop containing nucleoside triphosphate hydrolase protein [Rhodotorula diobovata]
MHPPTDLRALPSSALEPRYRAHLVRAGFTSPQEVLLSPSLSKRTRLAPHECTQLVDQLSRAVLHQGDNDTVASLVSSSSSSSSPRVLSTGDARLDLLLGGGIRVGSLTEVAGHSSSGKTHLCLQLALTAQLPPPLGGLGGGALFVSSEGTVPSPRLFQLAQHYAAVHRGAQDEHLSRTPTEWDFLDNVHAEKAPDLDTLAAVLAYHAPAFIERVAAHAASGTSLPLSLTTSTSSSFPGEGPPRPSQLVLASRPTPPRPPLPIKLVLVDSLAAPFRADASATTTTSSSFAQRAKDLSSLGDSLKLLAARHDCAVVVVNQVSDAFSSPAVERPLPPPPPPRAFLGPGPGSMAPPPHERHGLPRALYSRAQTPHFSGQAASVSSALSPLPAGFSGAGAGAGAGGGVHAALGHGWSHVPSTRLLLLVRRPAGAAAVGAPARTRRCAALVWSAFAPRAVLETTLGAGGLEGVGEVRVREVVFAEPEAEAEADAEGAASPPGEDEGDAEWWHSQAERAVREAERTALDQAAEARARGAVAAASVVPGSSMLDGVRDERDGAGGEETQGEEHPVHARGGGLPPPAAAAAAG